MTDDELTKVMCNCRMQQMGENSWIKPYDGYFDPEPDCSECGGNGYKETKIVFGEGATQVFIGMCVICGETNGVHFVYPGINEDDDLNDGDAPKCLNKECANYRQPVQWVEEEAVGD